jgi:uncharacterized membrane protein YjgN (DUF898 family)
VLSGPVAAAARAARRAADRTEADAGRVPLLVRPDRIGVPVSDQRSSAFGFSGRWQDYLPIALSNLLLTIVTLGIYRFWASARTRRYLWSHTRFIDENLEWTGTGGELWKGFLFAILLFFIPLFILQFVMQALVANGMTGLAGTLSTVIGFLLLFMVGFARFRALRYRLSRTYWHGIRGGSDNAGVGYAFSWGFKTVVGYITLWLLVPWSMISLWNERWELMSFGTERFRANARTGPVFKRFLLFYLAPVVIIAAIGLAVFSFGGTMATLQQGGTPTQPAPALVLGITAMVLAVYAALGMIALVYYSAFLREAIGHLSLGPLDFHFTARTMDFVWLLVVDALLVIGTLGFGLAFIQYRHWKFFVTHLEATGEVSLSAFGQSDTPMPTQGEGLLDALDVGAF